MVSRLIFLVARGFVWLSKHRLEAGPVLFGCDAGELAEDLHEVALARKAESHGYLTRGQRGRCEQILRPCDPFLQDKPIRRDAEGRTELPGEVRRAHAHDRGKLGHTDIIGQVLADVVGNASSLRRGMRSAKKGEWRTCPQGMRPRR